MQFLMSRIRTLSLALRTQSALEALCLWAMLAGVGIYLAHAMAAGAA